MTKKQLELLAQLIDCVSTLQDCLFKVDERLKKLDNHESEKNGKLVKKSFN